MEIMCLSVMETVNTKIKISFSIYIIFSIIIK